MRSPNTRRALLGSSLALSLALAAPTAALAQETPQNPAPEADPLRAIAAGLARVAAAPRTDHCTARCFTLEALTLEGSATEGRFSFELRGSVLAEHAVDVPLFGQAEHVRMENVTNDGQPVSVGFDDGHYFARLRSGRFVLRGAVGLDDERALQIPGPLNVLDARVTDGRLVEGARLSGLHDATVHFDTNSARAAAETAPTVFQLVRSVRVTREVSFEYQLTLRSGTELGVVRLPLPHGERVLSVDGVTQWRVDNGALVLPTAGRTASITVHGTLPDAAREFTADPRSSEEWWVFESDEEHRLRVETRARQMDPSRAPVRSTLPTSRAYLLRPGESLRATVQALAAVEVLAAVAHSYERSLVLTRRGDLFADDYVHYENNGIDHMALDPLGNAVFTSTDGGAQRILHGDDPRAVLVPLGRGSHTARVQSLTTAHISSFGGAMDLPMPVLPLTTSRATLRVGLPSNVHAVAVTGGDKLHFCFNTADALAIAWAAGVSLASFGKKRARVAGAVSLAGLWFASPGAFGLATGALAVVAAARLARRALRGTARTVVPAALAGTGALATVVFATTLSVSQSRSMTGSDASVSTVAPATTVDLRTRNSAVDGNYRMNWSNDNNPYNQDGDFSRQLQTITGEGVLAGGTPVALTVPTAARTITLTRELVTARRPLRARVYYVTDAGLLPLGLFWLMALGYLAFLHRDEMARARARIKARFEEAAGPVDAEQPAE